MLPQRGLSVCPSVRPSACMSVTHPADGAGRYEVSFGKDTRPK